MFPQQKYGETKVGVKMDGLMGHLGSLKKPMGHKRDSRKFTGMTREAVILKATVPITKKKNTRPGRGLVFFRDFWGQQGQP